MMNQQAGDAAFSSRDEEIVGHRNGQRHGPVRQLLRSVIHFLSYHLILTRRAAQATRAAGFRLTIRPTVFHPRWFISSESFAKFIEQLDLRGKSVVDVGTGSGILALAAARAGADYVVAADINPNAALSAADNAQANGCTAVRAVCSDLLSAIAPRPLFDVILSSPRNMPANRATLLIVAGMLVRLIAISQLCSNRPMRV